MTFKIWSAKSGNLTIVIPDTHTDRYSNVQYSSGYNNGLRVKYYYVIRLEGMGARDKSIIVIEVL